VIVCNEPDVMLPSRHPVARGSGDQPASRAAQILLANLVINPPSERGIFELGV
jgi:hypothetical protein